MTKKVLILISTNVISGKKSSSPMLHSGRASLANIRLGCEGLPGTNDLAYFASLSETKKKKFCNIVKVAKHFFLSLMPLTNII